MLATLYEIFEIAVPVLRETEIANEPAVTS